ncbi:MAG: DUF58 domain-containing protein [Bacteroidia bacterium]
MRNIKSLYLTNRLFICIGAFMVFFIVAFVEPFLFAPVQLLFFGLLALMVLDGLMLYGTKDAIFARRDAPERLSNGDYNDLFIYVVNRYNFKCDFEIIDEIPFQFQKRDVLFTLSLNKSETKIIRYQLRPTKRGEYNFGAVNVYAKSPLGLIRRRYQFSQNIIVPVYPSYLQLRQYELMAISHRLTDIGIKRIRRIGHSMEFEQIRDYVQGDDYRTVNWKATARKAQMMVNAYQDEKSQHVYSLIDKGRVMKMPFEGLTLLDYAINASLVVSSVALHKQDKAGVITFANKIGDILPAERKSSQMNRINDVLYHQQTQFLESDYELLYATIKSRISQRSLLILYTNYETINAMHRHLKFLRKLATQHLLLVVFFENTELKSLLDKPARTTEEIYMKTVAEKFRFEKKQIVNELSHYGIQSVLTPPEQLTINAINKYLEFKSRGLI